MSQYKEKCNILVIIYITKNTYLPFFRQGILYAILILGHKIAKDFANLPPPILRGTFFFRCSGKEKKFKDRNYWHFQNSFWQICHYYQ